MLMRQAELFASLQCSEIESYKCGIARYHSSKSKQLRRKSQTASPGACWMRLTVPGEQLDRSVWEEVDLASLPVILKLCQEVSLELAQCVRYSLADFCQHGLQRDSCSSAASE